MKQFKIRGVVNGIQSEDYFMIAENKVEATINFLNEVLNLKLSEYQKEDAMMELDIDNPIHGMIDVDEVLS
mgnify:CR=1 FL=1|jgi:hypothetical protein